MIEIYSILTITIKGHAILTVFYTVVVKSGILHLLLTLYVNVHLAPDRVFPDVYHAVGQNAPTLASHSSLPSIRCAGIIGQVPSGCWQGFDFRN